MVYINADGAEVEMCGNGVRAISDFGKRLNIPFDANGGYKIQTMNSIYETVVGDQFVKIKMTELYDDNDLLVEDLFTAQNAYYVNTGVPHTIFFVEAIADSDLRNAGELAHDGRFLSGCNINFVTVKASGELFMRTYERGVEDETLSCGTGAVAVAHAYRKLYSYEGDVKIGTLGGELNIGRLDGDYSLAGSVFNTFKGELNLNELEGQC
jgi:diaminopimelate epimerase